MNHVNKITRSGFTLVELMLALAFIGVLLLAIATTIIQIGANFNRGLTIKEVNQSGRSISEDIRYTVSSGLASSGVVNDGSADPGQGRLCLGTFSYVWNYGRILSPESSSPTVKVPTPASDGSVDMVPARFVRVSDGSRKYCEKSGSGHFVIQEVLSSDRPVELLSVGDRKLAIYKFETTSPPNLVDPVSSKRIHSLKFSIGAGDLSAIHPSLERCYIPGDEGAGANVDLTYCTVQTFNITVGGY